MSNLPELPAAEIALKALGTIKVLVCTPWLGDEERSAKIIDIANAAMDALAAIAADRAANSVAAPDGKYDEVLLPFFRFMESELHANCGKGDRPGWLTMTREQGLLEIYYHVSKLQKAVRDNDAARIRENTADVANMAMMLLDVCGGINSDGCWYCGSKPGEGCQKPFDDVPCRRAPSVGAGAAESPKNDEWFHEDSLSLVGWKYNSKHDGIGTYRLITPNDTYAPDAVTPGSMVPVYERAPLASAAVDAADRTTIDADSRAMFVSRLEHSNKNELWSVNAIMALMNDCDMLANRAQEE